MDYVARRRTRRNEPDDEIPLYVGLTANQVVAFNLAQARMWKNWTQDQAAQALEPHLGKRWSKANYSAAERSVDGNRIRNFTADEILAFALAFELPVTWFFMPPPPYAAPGVPAKLDTPDGEPFGRPLADLIDVVFGDDAHIGLLGMRLQTFLDQVGQGPVSQAQRHIEQLVDTRKAELVESSLGDLQRWQTTLRALANHLEDLEARAAALARHDLELPDDDDR
jgi:hypothetical protein